ncbi:DNA-directed DNA polymerase gamma MIP1 [Sporobolomyces koalae]|uniref:DNA-directed DNA polymerase gamma MIP1 n=1 Tax=Sporobolomyces koalae TaxID=500713 RepID=UPI00316C0669
MLLRRAYKRRRFDLGQQHEVANRGSQPAFSSFGSITHSSRSLGSVVHIAENVNTLSPSRGLREHASSSCLSLKLTQAPHASNPSTRSFSTSTRVQTTRSDQVGAPPLLNEVQVPLIAPNLRSQLFPPPTSPYAPPPPTAKAIEISRAHLEHHGLLSKSSSSSKKLEPAIDFKLPQLQGPTLSHHFHALGAQVAEPYLSLAQAYSTFKFPSQPDTERWQLLPGWTRYACDGSWEHVDFPPVEDQAMVFDVETLPYQGGVWPILAVAMGKTGWYAWCSPWVTGDDDRPNHLIPFGPRPPQSTSTLSKEASFESRSSLFESNDSSPRLLIGHNVLYDRARVESEYTLRRPSTRYIDTLSLHVAVSGLTNPQRPTWIKYRKKLDAEEAAEQLDPTFEAQEDTELLTGIEASVEAKKAEKRKKRSTTTGEPDSTPSSPPSSKPTPKTWKEVSSLNSLAEVARLHCGIKVDKSLRSVLIDPNTTLLDVRDNFAELLDYCAKDVEITAQVFQALLPKFLESCPHPATFAGVILMSQPVLPVDRKWPQYLERAEQTYQTRLEAVSKSLNQLAHEAKKRFDEAEPNQDGRYEWEDDFWLKQLDWTPKRARRLPDDEPSKRRTKSALEKAVAEAQQEVNSQQSRLQPMKKTKKSPRRSNRKLPTWVAQLKDRPLTLQDPLTPLLFEATYRSHPVVYSHSLGWLFAVRSATKAKKFVVLEGEHAISLDDLDPTKDRLVLEIATGKPKVTLYTVPAKKGSSKLVTLISTLNVKKVADGVLGSPYDEFEQALSIAKKDEGGETHQTVMRKLEQLAATAESAKKAQRNKSIWLRQLNWDEVQVSCPTEQLEPAPAAASSTVVAPNQTPQRAYKPSDLIWPKWYWDLDVPGHGLDVSIGKRAAPLLLRLRWKGHPIAHSKQHGWCYRIPESELGQAYESDPSLSPLSFTDVADMHLNEDTQGAYVQLPHPDGEGKNVGSPLSKPFVAAFEDGILTSEYPAAEAALALNASCSYWTSARERILNQMVVWEGDAKTVPPTPAALEAAEAHETTRGLILPQVIPMGTITRRAVERTWLTASNAKKNRVGSELKSMVQAPPGYAIVGADVDSEELWICSVMGDAQFGIHGATAIGWMTLEGTKSAGTDLHSKSASILGISRDDAKVFNYSRIYGAGVKHAVQLLIKSNPTLSTEQATLLAKNLYASTKGVVDRTATFKRNFWHGGTESFVFNKLEEIAQNDRPRTPALGCGLTAALTKAYLPAEGRSKAGEGYLPSRINWVVQSSGVDYLHLLLTSMEYLTKRFEIDARYLISVHDEIRYLVKEEDKYRAALALQVANLWTRSLFAYRLQMPDLPQGCAFFSAVDIDTCFRKEVNMTCVTPSNPDSIPFGESQDISDTLAHTSNGSLFADGRDMAAEASLPRVPVPQLADSTIVGERHRVDQTEFLVAQTSSKPSEIMKLWKQSIENARKTPVSRSRDNLGSVVDQPMKKIRSIRFEHEDEQHDVLRATPQQRRRRALAKSDRQSLGQSQNPIEDDEFDVELPRELDEDETYSIHKPLNRMHV